MSKKLTAVEWLIEQLLKKSDVQYINGFDYLVEQANVMHKEQIIKSRLSLDSSDNVWDKEIALELAEQYYKETYE
jgi:hypothetical protein